jgi:hypothetical protein
MVPLALDALPGRFLGPVESDPGPSGGRHMSGEWKEVARLRFKGDRFRDHALDLTALTELRQFQKVVAETTKARWKAANPDRERLPAHFEERTRLCLRRIDEGSAVAPLEVYVEGPPQGGLWESEPKEVADAIALAYKVLDAVEHDRPLPDDFPAELVTEYMEWGRTLDAGEEVELEPAGTLRAVRVTARNRERLARFLEAPHDASLEMVGEVLEADVRQRRFQLWLDAKTQVAVTFTETQEDLVTSALKEHRSVRMAVRGRGDVNPGGRPIRFTHVEELKLLRGGAEETDADAPPIEDEIQRTAAHVPPEEWARLPVDLTDQIDHYLYGFPKK